jgi:hypothetical protein
VNIGGLTPAVVTERHQVDGDALPRADAFRATLRNIAGVRLATGRMGLHPTRRLTAALRGDGTTRLTLAGRFPAGTRARLDGRRIRVTRVQGGIRLVLRLPAGADHRLVVAPPRR